MAPERSGARAAASALARREGRLAWRLVLPALAPVFLIGIFPLAWTVWESLHVHDLRMPWRGTPFVWLANYVEALGAPRFWSALAHTAIFTVASVVPELVLGLASALILNRAFRGRGVVRARCWCPGRFPPW